MPILDLFFCRQRVVQPHQHKSGQQHPDEPLQVWQITVIAIRSFTMPHGFISVLHFGFHTWAGGLERTMTSWSNFNTNYSLKPSSRIIFFKFRCDITYSPTHILSSFVDKHENKLLIFKKIYQSMHLQLN